MPLITGDALATLRSTGHSPSLNWMSIFPVPGRLALGSEIAAFCAFPGGQVRGMSFVQVQVSACFSLTF